MLSVDEVYNRLQCCYTELLEIQANNIKKLIFDEVLDSKVIQAYSLLKIRIYIQDEDLPEYSKSVNEVCSYKLNCICCDEAKTSWIGIDPICEEDGSTTTSTTTSSTTSTTAPSTTSSTTTSTIFIPPPIPTTTTTTTSTTTTSTTTTTNSTTTTSSTTTTTAPTTTTTTTSTSSSTSSTTVPGSSTTTTTAASTIQGVEESTYFSIN